MNVSHAAPATSADRIFTMLERGRGRQASDLHLEPGQGAAYRIYTRIERIEEPPPDADEIAAFLDETIDRLARSRLEKIGIADAVYADERIGAIRIHASRGKGAPRVAIRLLARSIPELQTLRLPEIIENLPSYGRDSSSLRDRRARVNRRRSPRFSIASTQRRQNTSSRSRIQSSISTVGYARS